jgi:hypothetical protein
MRPTVIPCLLFVVASLAPFDSRAERAGASLGNTDSNLVADGSFEVAEPAGMADGWNVSGPLTEAGLDDGEPKHGKTCQSVRSPGKSVLTIWQDVPVEPATVYLFSVWVRSDDRVAVQIGQRRMAYNRQIERPEGEWQKLAGLVRASANDKLQIKFLLGGLTHKPNILRIDDVRLQKADKPELPRRTVYPNTCLTKNGRAQSVIVYPASIPIYRGLAETIQIAVEEKTDVKLPIVSDLEATRPDRPVLLPEYRDRHLILLGRLGINRALWPAYNRFLCATDGYYPGGDGYVVRTAANVFRNGRNHVILGGSSEVGAARAVDRFVNMLKRQPSADRDLKLPWLLDVEMEGDCLEAFKARDQLWTADPLNTLLPPVEPGYGTVRRWYQNAMSWYWSGWESYRSRATDYLQPVLEDRAHTHHYILEFFVRTWDMVDDSPLFDDQTKRAVDDLICTNFWEFLTGPDLGWMKLFAPPYDEIDLVNRHAIAPLMADLKTADFLRDYFPLQGRLKDLVEYRRQEKHAFMRHLVSARWGPSLPGSVGTSHREEIVASMFRYALDHERYEFFTSGNAHRALGLERLNHVTGLFVKPSGRLDHHLPMGILAHWSGDGRYAWLLENIPVVHHVTGPFMGRYVSGVRRYTPGTELQPQDPDSFAGLVLPDLMPHQEREFPGFRVKGFQAADISADEVVELISLRTGFGPDDDFLVVSGLAGNTLPGTILSFTSRGTSWLSPDSSSWLGGGTSRYLDQNAVHVLRTDRWVDEASYPSAVKLLWSSSEKGAVGFAYSLEPFMDTRWERRLTQTRPGEYLIRDTITALEDGDYQIIVNWRIEGKPSWDGRSWTSVTDKGALRITPFGERFNVSHNLQAALESPGTKLFFRHVASTHLEKGESVTATTLLQTAKDRNSFTDWVQPSRVRETHHLAVGTSNPNGAFHAPYLPGNLVQNWRRDWTYAELLRPSRIRQVQTLDDGLVDLGRVRKIAEIRAIRTGPLWAPSPLPETIATAVPEDVGLPRPESDRWSTLREQRVWRPSVETGNYGKAIPVAEAFQVVRPENLEARYVRADGASELLYYDADELSAGRPLRLDVVDMDGDGGTEILVSPVIWPKFLRKRQEEDDTIALLDSGGKQLFKWEAPVNIQSVKVLDVDSDGVREIVAVTVDAKIRAFNGRGELLWMRDLFAMHRVFNQKEGRPNTRHPAGGLTMPYDFGLWRPDAGGKRKMVVSRYGACSFLDRAGDFEGVLAIGGYVTPAMLPYGIDFNGDGRDEQLCLVRGAVVHLDGDPTPTVRDPAGAYFYPQVYSSTRVAEPAWDTRIDGSPVMLFKPLAWGGGPRTYVLVVRDNYLGIYDAAERKWAFTWVPLVGIRSAAVISSEASRVTLLALTADDLLWKLDWKDNLGTLASFHAAPTEDTIRRMTADPGTPGVALLCGAKGLYQLTGDEWTRIAGGSFQFAEAIPGRDGRIDSVVAIDTSGRVARMTQTD